MIETLKLGADFAQPKSCPHCGHLMDTGQLSPADSESATAMPEEGDYGVCIHCAQFLVYVDNQGTARRMTPKDLHAMDSEMRAQLIDMRLTVKAMWVEQENRQTNL